MDTFMDLLSYLNLVIYMVSTQKFRDSISMLSNKVVITHMWLVL